MIQSEKQNGSGGHWVMLKDKQSGKKYYYHTASKETSWNRPADYVEPEWYEIIDKKSGKFYYYNKKTKETTWKKPSFYRPTKEARKSARKLEENSNSEQKELDNNVEIKEKAKKKEKDVENNDSSQENSVSSRSSAKKRAQTLVSGKSRSIKNDIGNSERKSQTDVIDLNSKKVTNVSSQKVITSAKGSKRRSETTGVSSSASKRSSIKKSSSRTSTDKNNKLVSSASGERIKSKRGAINRSKPTSSPTNATRSPKKSTRSPKNVTKSPKNITRVPKNVTRSSPKSVTRSSPKNVTKSSRSVTKSPNNESLLGVPNKKDGYWKESWDSKHKRKYYYHTRTRETTWKTPKGYIAPMSKKHEKSVVPLQQDEQKRSNPNLPEKGSLKNIKSGRSSTKLSSRGESSGIWKTAVDKRGRTYYYHSVTKEVSWKKPKELASSPEKISSSVESKSNNSVTDALDEPPDFMDLVNLDNLPDEFLDDNDDSFDDDDEFFQGFKTLANSTERDDIIESLNALDIPDVEDDLRVPKVIDMRKGLFYQLNRLLKHFENDLEIITIIVQILKKYGSLEEHVIKIVESDVAGKIISLMKTHSKSREIVADCLILLGNLALNDYVKELIRMEDGINAICEIMKNKMYHQDPDILDSCCYCLSNMAVDNDETVNDIIRGGALKCVINGLLEFPDTIHLVSSAVVVLANLCAAETFRVQIAQSGAVSGILTAIHSALKSDDEAQVVQILSDCLRGLGNMALNADSIDILFNEGSIPILLEVIRLYEDHKQIVSMTISVLGNISASCSAEQSEIIIRHGGITAVENASKAHIKDLKVQNAYLGALSNFCKAVGIPGGSIDTTIIKSIHHVVTVIKSMVSRDEIVSKGLRLLVRVAAVEHRSAKMASAGVHEFLLSSLVNYVNIQHSRIVRDILQCFTVMINELTASDLVNQKMLKEVLDAANKMVNDNRVVEAVLKCVKAMSSHQRAAILICKNALKNIVEIADQHRSKPSFVEVLASLIGGLAVYEGTVKYIVDTDCGTLLVDLLEEHQNSPETATSIITCLNNMMISLQTFAQLLQEGTTVDLVEQIRISYPRNNSLQKAINQFMIFIQSARTNGGIFVRKKYEDMDESEQHALLKAKFSVPTIAKKYKTFLQTGQVIKQHFESGQPKTAVHLYITPNLRFIHLRDPEKISSETEYPLRYFSKVQRGANCHALTKSKHIISDCCFSLHGMNSKNDTIVLAFECSSMDDRNQWVISMENIIQYRQAIVNRSKELTEEERDAYG